MSSRHVLQAQDLIELGLPQILNQAARIKHAHQSGVHTSIWNGEFSRILQHLVLAVLFYEPSTRTRLSFESAIKQLGGQVIGTENAGEFSSAAKGESLADSIRVVAGYAQAIVLRHPEVGSAALAAEHSHIPIINAGDGAGEHPTQALLDFFTIWEQYADSSARTLTVVGDLKQGRTVHSLVKLFTLLRGTELGLMERIICAAPGNLQLPQELREQAEKAGITVELAESLSEQVLSRSDVLYMTRTQKERGEDMGKEAERFRLTVENASWLPANSQVLHPLPRNDEISCDVDRLPQARYFEQARNGLYARMALLSILMR